MAGAGAARADCAAAARCVTGLAASSRVFAAACRATAVRDAARRAAAGVGAARRRGFAAQLEGADVDRAHAYPPGIARWVHVLGVRKQ